LSYARVALDRKAYLESLTVAGVDVDRLVPDSNGTICADEVNDATIDADGAGAELPVLLGANGDIVLGASLGDGGMGIVRSAEQRALRREVAVKSARLRAHTAEARSEGASALVREARITGALEHPNIVPVHTLGKANDGQVLLVMKRIEGKAWSQLLASRSPPLEDLRRHVEVLMDVCRAVSFAHSRGMLHRDLKPANVMVGPFGEVYVLDWGIAVPVGHTSSSIAGTPAFMAPEMAMPGRDVLDERTDVHLLGGLLHVVLTGRPPHVAATTADMLHAAFNAAPPDLPSDAPDELAAICRRALARDKSARFASAAAFRDALAAWVEHTSAHALCNEAQRQLASLHALVDDDRDAAGAVDRVEPPKARGAEREGAVYRAYSASRFGFEQALREWPEFTDARAGLRDALRTLARYELRMRRVDRARALLVDVDDEPSLEVELAAISRSLEAEEAERARLVSVGRSFLFRDGSRRLFITGASIAMAPWLAFAFFAGHLARAHDLIVTSTRMAAANLVPSLGFAALAVWMRKRDPHASNMGAMTSACCVGIVVMWFMLRSTDASIDVGFVIAHCIFLLDIVVGALFVQTAMASLAVPVLLSFPALLALPDYVFEINAATLVTVLVMLTALWPRSPKLS
jgi:serine/threonine-protein kinase